jgi:hypothetical protein
MGLKNLIKREADKLDDVEGYCYLIKRNYTT